MNKSALLRRILTASPRVAFTATLASLTLVFSSSVFAQGGRNPNAVPIFKSGGADRSAQTRRPPQALSALDLKKLAGQVGSEPGSVYVKLTVQEPSAANRGALVLVDPVLVEGGQNYASWGPPSSSTNFLGAKGSLNLWLRPATGKKYLIDCAVESSSPEAHFVVSGPAGTAPMTVDAIPGGQHLTVVLEATDNKWQEFQVHGVGTKKNQTSVMTPVDWTLYYCEVTNL